LQATSRKVLTDEFSYLILYQNNPLNALTPAASAAHKVALAQVVWSGAARP
jgi:hypothetical protein